MGKNYTGGNKQKSKKNNIPKQKSVPINEITPDNVSRYIAKVTKTLGSFRLSVDVYPTNAIHNALIPGSFRNKIWINTDDYVLIEVSTEISGNNCYIIHKYDSNELDELVNLGLLILKIKDETTDHVTFTDGNSNIIDDSKDDGINFDEL